MSQDWLKHLKWWPTLKSNHLIAVNFEWLENGEKTWAVSGNYGWPIWVRSEFLCVTKKGELDGFRHARPQGSGQRDTRQESTERWHVAKELCIFSFQRLWQHSVQMTLGWNSHKVTRLVIWTLIWIISTEQWCNQVKRISPYGCMSEYSQLIGMTITSNDNYPCINTLYNAYNLSPYRERSSKDTLPIPHMIHNHTLHYTPCINGSI